MPIFKVMAFAPAWSNITTTAEGKEKLNHSQKSGRWQVLASLIGVIKIMTSINIRYLISSVEQEKCNTCHFKLLCHVSIPSFPPGTSKILTKCVCTLQIFPEGSGVHMFWGPNFLSVGHSWWHLDFLIGIYWQHRARRWWGFPLANIMQYFI